VRSFVSISYSDTTTLMDFIEGGTVFWWHALVFRICWTTETTLYFDMKNLSQSAFGKFSSTNTLLPK